jgi:hypothetical protein
MPRHDLDFVCVSITPHEADAESIVDSDAVLCVPVTFERHQAVAGKMVSATSSVIN